MQNKTNHLLKFVTSMLLAFPILGTAVEPGSSDIIYVHQTTKSGHPYFQMRLKTISGSSQTLFGGCLTPISGYCAYRDPTLSPDKTRLTFVMDAVGEISCKTIWIADLDGKNAKQISRGCNHRRPTWSPNGKWIAYHAGNQIEEIDLCNQKSFPVSNPRRIAQGRNPSYSKNSRWIVFERNNDIYKIRRTGTQETALATASAMEHEPRWSKASFALEKIVFLYRDGSKDFIYTMDIDGQNKRPYIKTATEKHGVDMSDLSGFTWEENGKIMFGNFSGLRTLGPGREPSFGIGKIKGLRLRRCP